MGESCDGPILGILRSGQIVFHPIDHVLRQIGQRVAVYLRIHAQGVMRIRTKLIGGDDDGRKTLMMLGIVIHHGLNATCVEYTIRASGLPAQHQDDRQGRLWLGPMPQEAGKQAPYVP